MVVGAVALVLLGSTHAQNGEELLVRMRRAHQDQNAVYLKRSTTIRIERTTDGAVAFRDVEEQRLMLKDLSGRDREQQVYYSGMIPLKRLEAHTMVPSGKGHKRVPVRTVDHRDERSANIFHDDNRVASFLMPSMTSGAIGHVSYTLSFPDARLTNGHYFASVHPTEESTLTVISDPGIEVDIRMFHLADSMVVRSVGREKGRLVQKFTMRQVPPMQFESNAPAIRYYTPHAQLVVRIPERESGGNDIDRLYRWYNKYVHDAHASPTPELQALSDSIVGQETDPWKQASLIHGWVQDHIRYVAFEDGLNGFIPAAAGEVCRVRYGDCKGMSNLLQTLLRAAGLNAHLVWIGTRSIPYTFTELPTLANNDHMIVALDIADTTLFLDPTASENSFGIPSGFTQGKEALIALDSVNYRVQRIPVMPAEVSTIRDSLHLRLIGNDLHGRGVSHFTGYERYDLAHWLRTVPVHKRTEALREVLMKGSNKFLLDSCTISGLDDRDAPLTLTYHCRLPDQVMRSGERFYLPMVLTDPWKNLRVSEGRKLPVEVENQQMQHYTVTLELPPGSRCTSLPVAVSRQHEKFGYDIDMTATGNTVTSHASYRLGTLMIKDELVEWDQLNRSLLKELGRTVVFERQE
jgi:hypothetical protein